MLISAERQSLTLFHLWLESTQVRPDFGDKSLKLLTPKKLTNLDTLPCLRNEKYLFVLLRLREPSPAGVEFHNSLLVGDKFPHHQACTADFYLFKIQGMSAVNQKPYGHRGKLYCSKDQNDFYSSQ